MLRSHRLSRRLLVTAVAVLAVAACRDVGEFSTRPGESFCGPVVRGAFVRAGFAENVQMQLVLDAERLESAPGFVTTSDGMFSSARLRPVPQLFRDPLSTLQFGEGRRRNLLYVLDPAAGGASVMTVLSLMDNGSVEVRLLRGATADVATDGSGGSGGAGSVDAAGGADGSAAGGAGGNAGPGVGSSGASGAAGSGASGAAGSAAGDAGALFGVFQLARKKGSCGFLVRRLGAFATSPLDMLVLGIESSCDETAAAVVDGEGMAYADVIRSQIALHGPYGGVVPELAAREHLVNVMPVVEAALEASGRGLGDIDGIAVTVRPGLSGALLVGAQVARTMAWSTGLPLVGVDHLVGHLLSVHVRRPGEERELPAYPYVALLASGGHTAIYRVDGPLERDVTELGGTRDDAAGEAFDKFAKMLGLGYPGGPLVDRMAARGDASKARLPKPMPHGLEFSFSGLKSLVARQIAEHGRPADDDALADLCAGFQRAVVETLTDKTLRAAQAEGVERVVLAGGVAANRGLRAYARERCDALGLGLFVPPPANCTDNAAMIAYAGAMRLRAGERDETIATASRTALKRATRKGRGARLLRS